MSLKSRVENNPWVYLAIVFSAGIGMVLAILNNPIVKLDVVQSGSYILKDELTIKYIPINEAKKKYVPQWEAEIRDHENKTKQLANNYNLLESQYRDLSRKEASLSSQLTLCEEQKKNLRDEFLKQQQHFDLMGSEIQKMKEALSAYDIRLKKRAELLQKTSGWVNQDLLLEIREELKNK